jgi:hypothetical protein
MVNQDASNQLGRECEKMISIAPLHLPLIEPAQICFANQRCALQSMASTFPIDVGLGKGASTRYKREASKRSERAPCHLANRSKAW